MIKSSTSAAPIEEAPSASLDFCLRLARAYSVLTRRLDNALGNLHGLGFSDFMVLYHLQRAPATRLRRIDLAERLGLTASGVTRTLLPLEKLGLVARQPDPRDARVGYASITAADSNCWRMQWCRSRPSARKRCMPCLQIRSKPAPCFWDISRELRTRTLESTTLPKRALIGRGCSDDDRSQKPMTT